MRYRIRETSLMICSQCGKEVDDSSIHCPSRETNDMAISQTPPSTQSEKPNSGTASLPRASTKIGLPIIITGTIMMLLSLFLDLYTVDYYPKYLDFGDLLNPSIIERRFEQDFNWYGTSLPLILIIVFASISILSIVYTLTTGQRFRKLWFGISILSVVTLTANFLYLRFAVCSDCFGHVNPHIGWVLAFVGAMAIGAGAIVIDTSSTKKLLSQIASLPRLDIDGFLIIITGAIMMLSTMLLDWYTIHGTAFGSHGDEYPPLDFGALIDNSLAWWGFNWLGAALPPILIILFASIAFLSIIYTLATGRRFRKLWIWLGLLSIAALIANLLYLCADDVSRDYSWGNVNIYVTPRVGWILAFIGAIAICIGALVSGTGGNMNKSRSV